MELDRTDTLVSVQFVGWRLKNIYSEYSIKECYCRKIGVLLLSQNLNYHPILLTVHWPLPCNKLSLATIHIIISPRFFIIFQNKLNIGKKN